jgi:hypothetical protein
MWAAEERATIHQMLDRIVTEQKGLPMGDAIWFFHHAGTQRGPMSWSELRGFADRGEIDPEDLVWQPDLSDWQPARTVADLLPNATTKPDAPTRTQRPWKAASGTRRAPETMGPLIPAERLLHWLARIIPPSTLDRLDRTVTPLGIGAYLGAALLATVLLLQVGIRDRQLPTIFCAVFTPPLAVFAAYAATRFLIVLRRNLTGAASHIGEGALLEGVAAIQIVGALGCVVFVVWRVTNWAGTGPVLFGIGASLLLLYAAFACLNPASIGIAVDKDVPIDAEVIGALEAITKVVFLRLPTVVLALAALGSLSTIALILATSVSEGAVTGVAAVVITARALAVGLLPAASWVAFLILWTTLRAAHALIDPAHRDE